MFDLFNTGATNAMEEKFKEIVTQLTAITVILVEKKIVSEDEFSEFKEVARTMADKAFKDAKDEATKQFEKEFPVFSQFFKNTKVGENINE